MFEVSEFDLEQRRRMVDVQQVFEQARAAQREQRTRFAGSMAWKSRDGRDYLYRRIGRVEKSLGPRSDELEAGMAAFNDGKARGSKLVESLRGRLAQMGPVNRAMGLGRVPLLVARILRRLDEVGVLGKEVCVVGTNAMYAFEAVAGVRFGTGLLATDDLDVALDARRRLALAGRFMPAGFVGLLQQVDPSFAVLRAGDYRVGNASGLLVDLITPEPRNPLQVVPGRLRRLGGSADTAGEDATAVEVPRLEMIVDAPRMTGIALDERGLPVAVVAADPRWWTAHKLWLAGQGEREPVKRARDRAQALAVAAVLGRQWSNLDLSDMALSSIPATLRTRLRLEVEAARQAEEDAPW